MGRTLEKLYCGLDAVTDAISERNKRMTIGENLQALQKMIKECKENGTSDSAFERGLLTSIALSLAQIADSMAESEDKE